VETRSLADLQVDSTTLGRVYNYRSQAAQPAEANQPDREVDPVQVLAGTNAVAQTLSAEFGVTSEHYVTIALDQIPVMIDTLGGVTVNIPARLETGLYTFEPGLQTLDGDQLKEYVRFLPKPPPPDWERIARQNLVLDSLRQELLDPSIITKIPELFELFRDAIITDLTPAEIASLTCLLQEVPADQIIMDQVHEDMVTLQADGSLLPDEAAIRDLLGSLGLVE